MNQNHSLVRKGDLLVAIVSREDAKRVVSCDCPFMRNSKEFSHYVEANSFTGYILINTWLMQTTELSRRTTMLLRTKLINCGLIQCIKDADELANALIHEESDLTSYEGYPVWSDLFLRNLSDLQSLRSVLEVLRYPKRYSPVEQEDATTQGLNKFFSLNRKIRYLRVENGIDDCACLINEDNYFMEDLKAEVERLTKGSPLDPEYYTECWASEHSYQVPVRYAFEDHTYRYGAFSNGTTFELNGGSNVWLNKQLALAKLTSYYRDEQHVRATVAGKHRSLIHHASCKVLAVPKSYKTPRIIAKEPAWRNYLASCVRAEYAAWAAENLADWRWFCIDDQDPNRNEAWESSFTDKYATIDLSSASDSISAALGAYLFPLFRVIPELRSCTLQTPWRDKDGDPIYYRSNIFLTSGHPLTFTCETIVFLAIARVATRYAHLFYDRRYKFVEPRAYGDDMEVDVRAYDTCVDILERLGFCVNHEKSFTAPSNYRESCGVEYLHGYPMHGCKWPRTTFDWTDKDSYPQYVASLIDLQHSMFYHSCEIEQFLSAVVVEVVPSMTFSEPGSEFNDLWSSIIPAAVGNAPEAAEKPLDTVDREILATMGTRRRNIHTPCTETVSICESELTLEQAKRREFHSIPQGQVQLSEKDKLRLTDPTLELALYVDFLLNGPRYEDSLMELLHVTSPVDRRVLIKQPKIRWIRVRR